MGTYLDTVGMKTFPAKKEKKIFTKIKRTDRVTRFLPIPGNAAYVVQRLGLGPRGHRGAQLVHVPDVQLRLGSS